MTAEGFYIVVVTLNVRAPSREAAAEIARKVVAEAVQIVKVDARPAWRTVDTP